jgi:hypothetical protein
MIDPKILKTLTNDTIIEAGHYSYKTGPNDLDTFLWESGVELYAYAKKHFKKIGLLVLVDDVHEVETNAERKNFKVNELPNIYLQILKKYNINIKEIIIVSQNKIREKGRRLLREKGMSRTSTPQCRLIVATLIREKENYGYNNAIVLYDEIKSANGQNLTGGAVFSRILYNTIIKVHYFVFKNKNNYKYYFMTAKNVTDEKIVTCS